MLLSTSTFIAGHKTVADWIFLRPNLINFSNLDAWREAVDSYFKVRLADRYLNAIESIKDGGSYRGEGFSIMTIICALVEFLESTYQGINYKHRSKGDPPLTKYEYAFSGSVFISFLTKRNPFKNYFNLNNAAGFYKNVRCGLFHEARTSGKWTIWGHSSNNRIIEEIPPDIIVYRNNFYEALQEFINNEYPTDLYISDERKHAFIRKFDRLCEE